MQTENARANSDFSQAGIHDDANKKPDPARRIEGVGELSAVRGMRNRRRRVLLRRDESAIAATVFASSGEGAVLPGGVSSVRRTRWTTVSERKRRRDNKAAQGKTTMKKARLKNKHGPDPIGWWCPSCGELHRIDEHDGLGNFFEAIVGVEMKAWIHAPGCEPVGPAIPIHAREIPEGERPQTNEPDNEDIVVTDEGLFHLRLERSADPPTSRFPMRWLWDGNNDIVGRVDDIGDAVLWVVEGKRP